MANDQETLELEEFTLKAPTMPVHSEGLYLSLWTGLKADTRVKFGVKNRDSQLPSDLEKCIKLQFTAIDENQPKFGEALKLWKTGTTENRAKALELITFKTYKDDDGNYWPIRFNVTLGMNFIEGSTRSNNTKTLQGIIGRKLTSKEVAAMGMVKLFTHDLNPINVTVTIEDGEDGERNKIASIRRPDKFQGKDISPINIDALRVEIAKPAPDEAFAGN